MAASLLARRVMFDEALGKAMRLATFLGGREGACVRTKLQEAGLWAGVVKETREGDVKSVDAEPGPVADSESSGEKPEQP